MSPNLALLSVRTAVGFCTGYGVSNCHGKDKATSINNGKFFALNALVTTVAMLVLNTAVITSPLLYLTCVAAIVLGAPKVTSAISNALGKILPMPTNSNCSLHTLGVATVASQVGNVIVNLLKV